jgi:predicted dinucleotide-binding enzyme
MEIPAAIREADIIVFAVWFTAIKELLHQYATELKGKIIVDPSNPIAPDEKGGFKKIIGDKESAGEVIAELLPENAKLVKALGTLGVASLANAAFQKPAKVLFYATDDTSINEHIEQLIRDNGFEPVRVGSIDQSIRIEVFGDLHEFGALGKTVTRNEVKQAEEISLL